MLNLTHHAMNKIADGDLASGKRFKPPVRKGVKLAINTIFEDRRSQMIVSSTIVIITNMIKTD